MKLNIIFIIITSSLQNSANFEYRVLVINEAEHIKGNQYRTKDAADSNYIIKVINLYISFCPRLRLHRFSTYVFLIEEKLSIILLQLKVAYM